MSDRPGIQSEDVTPGNFLLSDHMIEKRVTIDSTARDSGNTPTTKLRAGLCLGKVTATGKYKEYDNGDVDGTETLVGILLAEVNLLDDDATAQDTLGRALIHGYVDESALVGIDANGKADAPGQIIFG